ncbi:hypothetical protein [Rhodanobacter sp. KK11]|jgi:hypothetical protein|uniref:hypothetical protein n=1 Tax=Rhodanobacter sp. KK11 TaxID=3083255 RepID=UPI0029676516|nr:hypothetical protein [Rhodanobacter sp. KK11]MDW2981790.1 hypothetical protein [Rhodanobacter sp. KK11]
MNSNRIGSGSSITSLIRSVSRKVARTGVLGQGGTVSAHHMDMPAEKQSTLLRGDLIALIREVDLESEAAVRALRRPVLRRILLSEFGESFVEHPDFAATVDRIESAMDADPAMPDQFLALLRHLRG